MASLTLSKLTLDGIGPFENATIDLSGAAGRLVFFEGPNGCGKSTIVQLIAAACANVPAHLLLGQMNAQRLAFRPVVDQRMAHADMSYAANWDGPGAVVAVEGLALRTRGSQAEASAFLGLEGHGSVVRTYRNSHFHPLSASGPLATQLSAFHAACGDGDAPTSWAAFAYRAHQPTPIKTTAGPKEIVSPALRGCLGFGDAYPVAADFGQLLANLDNERTKAFTYANEPGAAGGARKDDLDRIQQSRRDSIRRFEEALSSFLDREVTVRFSVEQQSPDIRFDGIPIPLDALGEGMRSSIAWLGDLLVRLERARWTPSTTSPLDREFWLILDEIDESLHPKMQARIYPALLKLFPNARIFATTHSPFVVASVGEGTVVPIGPDPKTRLVSGNVAIQPLQPGQSLEFIVRRVFEAEGGIIDEPTRTDLDEHRRAVREAREGRPIDWTAFFERRRRLYALNEEVRAIVAMTELPIRGELDRRLPQQPAA